MFRIVTGPFHPQLEDALAAAVRQAKADPFTPLAIVLPSTLLAARIRRRLVLEDGLPLLNVHVLTFHQLALRLSEERQLSPPDGTAPAMELAPDFFFRHLLSRIGRRAAAVFAPLGLSTLPAGGWAALWATVRDLKDSAVEPAVARRAVEEGVFDVEDAPKLNALFALHSAALEAASASGMGTADDLASAAASWAQASGFLRSLGHIFYYGFYDLTQVQLAFFEAVIRTGNATLFFPLEEGPRAAFARRFFERYLQPLAPSAGQITALPVRVESLPAPAVPRIMSAVGPDDELTLVCKEILTLIETHGYGVDEIGVVARTLEPYRSLLRRIFDAHRIPFVSTASAPLTQQPVIKVLLQLAGLPLADFACAPVLDVLTSPCYRLPAVDPVERIEPRPDLWRLAADSLGIRKGESDWLRLKSAGAVVLPAGAAETGEDWDSLTVPRGQIALLWRVVSALIEDCRVLPAKGDAGTLTDAFMALATKHVAVSDMDVSLEDAFARMRQLDRVGGTLRWAEWVELWTRLLEETSVPIEPPTHRGVQVLDAMAARGLPFRALFLIGLNEKVFPRFIREDAFLRDRHRRVLEETLGYKIDEKLAGYDEEALLYTLLTRSARSRLYLVYQRADADGRPLAPSPYLTERTVSQEDVLHLPRRFSDRVAWPQFAPPCLTRDEWTMRLLLDGYDPTNWMAAAGREAILFRNGLTAVHALDAGPTASTRDARDGMIGPLERHWKRLAERGVSPTSLEAYARCPFQYFAGNVLRLEPVREPPIVELPAPMLGRLLHAALNVCAHELVASRWPESERPPGALREDAAAATETVFARHAAQYGTGYALIWDMAKEMVTTLVAASLDLDQQDHRETGFRPVSFEVEAAGMLRDPESMTQAVRVHGRWDRVDRRTSDGGMRVIDYKLKQSRAMKGEDRDLVTAAIRGFRLQPPLYALMELDGRRPQWVELRFLAPGWTRTVERAEFDAKVWQGAAGRQLQQSMRTLLDGVQAGRFFMLPDPRSSRGEAGYCDFCSYAAACRRFHGPSWWRAFTAEPARALRLLRKQKAARDDVAGGP